MMAEERGSTKIEQVSDDEAREHLKATYVDSEAAGRFLTR
jgi:hypothetical protein